MTRMADIWAVMKSMYPHAFKEFGPVDGPICRFWANEMNGANLDAGLAKLRQRTSQFPPSLPEFKQMCGALVALPKNDEDMRRWAIAEGYGDARPNENWKQYRARIEAAVERVQEAEQIPLDSRRLLS